MFLVIILLSGVPRHCEAILYSLSLIDNTLFLMNLATPSHPVEQRAITMVQKLGLNMYDNKINKTDSGMFVATL